MTNETRITRRLSNQGLAGARFETAAEVVGWLGAVQAQDYAGAKWAVGQRMAGASDAALDRAFDAGEILRTHVMRPTWHFVTPEDIRWMLELTAPRVAKSIGTYDRQLGLDDALYARSTAVIAEALRGGNFLTRVELTAALQKAGIEVADTLRAAHMMSHAELAGVVCSGPRAGKQQTYALIEERAPGAIRLTRDESLARLALRYFTSHGPATLKDYVWWSGLTAADAKRGIALAGRGLAEQIIDGVSHWLGADGGPAVRPAVRVHLLPNYDEYIVGYVDRAAIIDEDALHRLDPRGNPADSPADAGNASVHQLDPRGNVLFSHTILIDGKIAGTWRREFKRGAAVIETKFLTPPTPDEATVIEAAFRRYGEFLGMPIAFQ